MFSKKLIQIFSAIGGQRERMRKDRENKRGGENGERIKEGKRMKERRGGK